MGVYAGDDVLNRVRPVLDSIQNESMGPKFKDGDYTGGLVAGLAAYDRYLAGLQSAQPATETNGSGAANQPATQTNGSGAAKVLLLSAVALISLGLVGAGTVALVRRVRRIRRVRAEIDADMAEIGAMTLDLESRVAEVTVTVDAAQPDLDDRTYDELRRRVLAGASRRDGALAALASGTGGDKAQSVEQVRADLADVSSELAEVVSETEGAVAAFRQALAAKENVEAAAGEIGRAVVTRAAQFQVSTLSARLDAAKGKMGELSELVGARRGHDAIALVGEITGVLDAVSHDLERLDVLAAGLSDEIMSSGRRRESAAEEVAAAKEALAELHSFGGDPAGPHEQFESRCGELLAKAAAELDAARAALAATQKDVLTSERNVDAANRAVSSCLKVCAAVTGTLTEVRAAAASVNEAVVAAESAIASAERCGRELPDAVDAGASALATARESLRAACVTGGDPRRRLADAESARRHARTAESSIRAEAERVERLRRTAASQLSSATAAISAAESVAGSQHDIRMRLSSLRSRLARTSDDPEEAIRLAESVASEARRLESQARMAARHDTDRSSHGSSNDFGGFSSGSSHGSSNSW